MAVNKTGSKLIAYAFMSDHVHLAISTNDVSAVVSSFRIRYNKYFNCKYRRKGNLGERRYFYNELKGSNHIMAAISYILKNPLHHNITRSPLGYPFSSVRCYFSDQIWGEEKVKTLNDSRAIREYISYRDSFPSNYEISCNGHINPKSVVEYRFVENYFRTPAIFSYFLYRKSGEDWKIEQEQDKNGIPPIDLGVIESGTQCNIHAMLMNERGRRNIFVISDLELCKIIDDKFLPVLHKESFTELLPYQKSNIAEKMIQKFGATSKQVKRCLG
jgi:hypothetical protein